MIELVKQLRRAASTGMPANVALMRLLISAPDESTAACALAKARAQSEDSGEGGPIERIAAIEKSWRDHPNAWGLIRSVVADYSASLGAPDDALAHWAAFYDSVAKRSPEASVAL